MILFINLQPIKFTNFIVYNTIKKQVLYPNIK